MFCLEQDVIMWVYALWENSLAALQPVYFVRVSSITR